MADSITTLNNNRNRNRNHVPGVDALTPIQAYYNDCNVFITGGTGFLGKILIEKLLRSTNVATIYLLVRSKKGKDIDQRIDELLDDEIFARLRAEVPKYKHRVEGIAGDCCLAGLGISIQDRHMLQTTIHLVFHVAATVNFNERLDLAYDINVNGTKAMMDLCRPMPKLKSLIHVSTAYSNCHLEKIDEQFYDYSIKYTDLESILSKLDKTEIEQCTPRIIGKWPNTYAFTKAMAETVIRDKSDGLPVGIFRPAIVISTYKEPIEAWTDNLYGPTGVMAAAASGVLRTVHCDDSIVANVVPVDTCVAALIATAWEVGTRSTTIERVSNNIPIYNFVSSVENPITWAEHNTINHITCAKYPMSKQMWKVCVYPTKSTFKYEVAKFFFHQIPAAMLDTVSVLTGQKPRMLKLYGKIHKFSSAVAYFSLTEFKFSNDRVQALYERLSPADQKLFPMSMRNVNWLEYYRKYLLGVRKYLLKDPIDTLPAAVQRQNKFEILHTICKYTFIFLTANAMWGTLHKLLNLATSKALSS